MKAGPTFELPLGEPRNVFTVSALNREARLLIEQGFGILWVEGEVSNLSRPSSGHVYWSLKDAQAQVRCAMFARHRRFCELRLDNGQHVLVRGRVSLYEARGDFQLLVEHVEEAGEGVLRRRFEELKRKLAEEGLFDAERKRVPPRIPTRIGVVTSPTGAAVRDVLTVLGRRFPAIPVLIYPTAVQGEGAAAEISRTLKLADARGDCDVLILARGGGSLEDLWPFNEEVVARTLAAMRTPVIAGVGHEIDFTIADFVADLRAPTPSQAAELAVPEQAECCRTLERLAEQSARLIRRRAAERAHALKILTHRLFRSHPGVSLRESSQRLDELEARLRAALVHALHQRMVRLGRLSSAVMAANPARRLAQAAERHRWSRERLRRAMTAHLERRAKRLALAGRALDSLSPLATLGRGYAIVSRLEDGAVLRDSASIASGTRVGVRLARGSFTAKVDQVSSPPGEDTKTDP